MQILKGVKMNKTFKLSAVAASLLLSGVLVGCGSSSSSSAGDGVTPPDDTVTTRTITVVDGYVGGANVSLLATGVSAVAVDGDLGKYTIDASTSALLMSVGGTIDINGNGIIDAGEPKAPIMYSVAGSDVINPFTTFMALTGKSEAEIIAIFKLDEDTDLKADFTEAVKEQPALGKAAVALGRSLLALGDEVIMAALLPSLPGDTGSDNDTSNDTDGDSDGDAPVNEGDAPVNEEVADVLKAFEDASEGENDTNGVLRATGKPVDAAIAGVSDDDITLYGMPAIENNAAVVEATNAIINGDDGEDEDEGNGGSTGGGLLPVIS